MVGNVKSPAPTRGTAWKYLYRAGVALGAARGADAVAAAAGRLAVPRLADGCVIACPADCPAAGLRGRSWPAGGAGPGDPAPPADTLTEPLVADGRSLGTMTLTRAAGRPPFGRARWVARRFAAAVAAALARAAAAEPPRPDAFTAALVHELRNAFTPIPYGLETLRIRAARAQDCGPTLDQLDRQVGRLNDLLTGMLELDRAERAKLALRVAPVDLGEVAGEAGDVVGPLAREKDLRLSVRVSPAARAVEADSLRLGQVLTNLLLNAVKHTGPGGRVDLTAARVGGAVVIRVRDTGAGIAPELLPRVFDPFVQADASRGGLGLGLALVRRLVELHGGRVWAQSDGPGLGSTFAVRIPVSHTRG